MCRAVQKRCACGHTTALSGSAYLNLLGSFNINCSHLYFNNERVFRALNGRGVRYVAGGIALNLHGVPRATADLDIAVALDEQARRG